MNYYSNNKNRNRIMLKDKFKNIKCNYFLIGLFDNLDQKKSLKLIKYNKNLQNRINININNYKEYLEIYSPIEIEIIPFINEYGKFIHINKDDEIYYHIYFNDNKKEIKKNYFNKDDKVEKKLK